MRVAHVSIVHPPFDTRIFHRQCRSLAAGGYDVHLLVSGPSQERHGVRLHSLAPTWAHEPLRRQWRLQRNALRASWRVRADVYHLHDPHLIPLGLTMKLRGAHVVYDVHENYPHHARSKLAARPLRARVKSAVWGGLETLARGAFDGFVCASNDIAGRFPAERAAVLHNFPRADEPAFPELPAYRERPPNVAYVGVHALSRGLLESVQAMEVLPEDLNCRLRFVGSIRPTSDAALVVDRPGWRRVDHVPWQPRERMWQELGRARIGLVALPPLPNNNSGARSNKLFEYMAAGLPVVTSDHPGWRSLSEATGCGLAVDARDPAAIAQAIEYLLSHPDEAEEMGRRGRALVEGRYNWESEVGRLFGLYSSLDGRTHPAA